MYISVLVVSSSRTSASQVDARADISGASFHPSRVLSSQQYIYNKIDMFTLRLSFLSTSRQANVKRMFSDNRPNRNSPVIPAMNKRPKNLEFELFLCECSTVCFELILMLRGLKQIFPKRTCLLGRRTTPAVLPPEIQRATFSLY